MDKDVLTKALQSLVDHGIARSCGDKLVVSPYAFKHLSKLFMGDTPVPIKPTYEIEVDLGGEK